MDQRTSNNVGTPDFLFAIKGQAIAWEAKLPKRPFTVEQQVMRLRLEDNGWKYAVIHTIDEAIDELETYERTTNSNGYTCLGRSPVFEAWMQSLESKTVKRINIYMPNAMVKLPYRNYANPK